MDIKLDENFIISRPFGPSVAKVKIPKNIVHDLNNYIEQTILDNKKVNDLNAGPGLAGDVTQEFKLENEFITKCGWLKFLATSVQKWIKVMQGKDIKKFNMISSWVDRQFKHGVDYLGGQLTLIHGSRQFLSNSKLQIKPEVGDFYFFPNYLMHSVYPFKGTDEERRSISFNAYIDDDIYNVWGR